ncbi:aldehyde dehydrogenase family protein [Lentzea tibetensis]|uniref:Aldehyde dehydrogenase family protein n=1 Tax=Lentzea tibetensis TaxID=2591470 RepID=A0A563EJR4_9PSEU|nr:aldehyde dehydrogenase family protein [Lentzea tibetensis]TWP46741.1 aldehyde dehydrogenase family protein [Lentzea tibetensis]
MRISNGRHYIDGDFVVPASGATAPVQEKATNAVIGEYALGNEKDVRLAVASSVNAQKGWAALLPAERAAAVRKIARVIENRADDFVHHLMRETGGVEAKARGEVGAALSRLNVSAAQAQLARGEIQPSPKPGKLTLLERIPLGVVGVITPWNFPLVLAMRAMAPALAVGNAVVLKPAELTPIAGGQLLAEVCHEAGIPPGVFNVVTGDGPDAGEPLAAHPDVALVHFTGSNEIGVRVAGIAARDLRRTCLELGGDNAFAVLDDADVEAAATCGAWTSFDFQGQTCITASRHIVHRAVLEPYLEALTRRARQIVVGDPTRPGVHLGPLISAEQLHRVHDRIVQPSIEMGARVVTGATHDGLFYQPTVLADVTPEMPAFTEEIFGPVAPVTVVDSEEEALALVNRCQALVNAVHTGDLARGLAFAQQVDSKNVHVNDAGPRPTDADDVDLDEFTKRRWIGLQRSSLTYPDWAR